MIEMEDKTSSLSLHAAASNYRAAVALYHAARAAVDAAARSHKDTAIDAAADDARKSIVAFLNTEGQRFDSAARGISSEAAYSAEVGERHSRLVVRASMCRTLAAQIERGDDRQGGE